MSKVATDGFYGKAATMAGNGDLQSHEKTYDRLIGMMKYGGIAVFIVAFLVIWLIS